MNAFRRGRPLVGTLAVGIVLVYVCPWLYLVLTSFKPPAEAISIPPTILPETFSIDSYRNILSFPNIPRAFLNSTIAATLSTLLAIALATPAAWAITRYGHWPGRIFLFAALITRMIPSISIAIPFFALMRNLRLTDTHLALALAHTTISLPLAIWLLTSFLEAIPVELEEAARIDGCSRWGALLRVILPVAAGGIAATSIFCFLASWNEFLFALMLTSVDAQTAPLAIANLKTQFGVDWGPMAALGTLYSFPVILFSLFMQRRIVAGMTMGAVKG